MEREAVLDHFHDSDRGDIYDLYNACNGAMRAGLLDVRKLDDLSAEEREVFDVPRLREVWEHATRCGKCEYIVKTLNLSRRKMRAHAVASSPEQVPVPKAKQVET